VAGSHERGRCAEGVPSTPGGEVLGGITVPLTSKNDSNFEIKMQGFMHFYCEKLLEDRNQDWGLNRPLGLKM